MNARRIFTAWFSRGEGRYRVMDSLRHRATSHVDASLSRSARGRFQNLDAFRGICAFVVFVYHFYAHISFQYFMPEGSAEHSAYLAGWYVLQALSTFAVLGFFVMSGLVITLHIKRDIAPEGKYAEFLFFRFTRISFVCVPVTVVSLLLALLFQRMYPGIEWTRYNDYSLWQIVGSMAGLAREWNWPGWTLIVEWAFYLIVAGVGALISGRARNVVLAGACLFVFTQLGLLADSATLLVSFFLGAMLVSVMDAGRLDWRMSGIAGLTGVVALLFMPDYMPAYEHPFLKSAPLALLVLSFARMPEAASAIMVPLRYLGKISFSLYCWHWPVILFGCFALFGRPDMINYQQVVIGALVFTPALFILSHLSYWLFERNYRLRFLSRFSWPKSVSVDG